MDPNLRVAWTGVITPEDYEQHMAAIGQAQAVASITAQMVQAAQLAAGVQVVIAAAGTGQMFDYLDPVAFRPFRLTCTDLNPGFLARLQQRLARYGLTAAVLEDDIEQTALEPGAGLLLAALLLEHIDWLRGVEVFASLRPAICGVIIQENPEGMTSAVTPGRRLPPSMATALETARPALVPRDRLIAAFGRHGYRPARVFAEEVADGKRLAGLLMVQ